MEIIKGKKNPKKKIETKETEEDKEGEEYLKLTREEKEREEEKRKFNSYIDEFRKMDIITKKKIIFLMKKEDILILFKKLSKIYDPEKIFLYIKYLYPELININLASNKIQLSRDEELLIFEHLK